MGTNTRRVRGALLPLLPALRLARGGAFEGRGSRLVGRLREDFEPWAKRDLGEHWGALPLPRWLVPASADREEAGTRTGLGDTGRVHGRPPRRGLLDFRILNMQ